MKRDKTLKIVWAIPLIIMISIVPLIVIYKRYWSEVADCPWIRKEHFFDFFLFYKASVLKLIGIFLLILLIYWIWKGKTGFLKEKNSPYVLIPAGVFILFSLISALLSEHQNAAFAGGFDTFEGFFVLLSYICAFVYVYAFGNNEKWVSCILRALIIGSLVIGLIGTLQVFGVEYFTSKWYRPIMSLFYSGELNPGLVFEPGTSFTTLYNPDYVGSYVALVLPVLSTLIIYEKNILFKVLAAVSAIMQIIILIGAGAAGGFIGLAISILIFLVFLFFKLSNKFVIIGIVLLGVICSIGFVKSHPTIFTGDQATKNSIIENIEGKKGEFRIYASSGKVIVGKLRYQKDICSFLLTDEDGNTLRTKGNLDSTISIQEKGYESIYISTTSLPDADGIVHTVLQIGDGSHKWNLTILENNKVGILNFKGKLDKIVKVKTFGFKSGSWFLNGRGHIWARTFPIMIDTIFFGVGSDNFVYAYPNDDYVGRVNNGEENTFFTKPHNMYMQIWIQNGMFACIALIILYVYLFIDTIRLCLVKTKKNKMQGISIGVLSGVTGYLVVGLVNDMNICVAPVFWILFGLGFACNRFLSKQAKT